MANPQVNPEIFIQHYQGENTNEDFLKETENHNIAKKVLNLIEITPDRILENLRGGEKSEDFIPKNSTDEDYIKAINAYDTKPLRFVPRVNPESFLNFYKHGNTTEDILKSENDIKKLAYEIFEAKAKNEDQEKHAHLEASHAAAKKALDLIAKLGRKFSNNIPSMTHAQPTHIIRILKTAKFCAQFTL